MKWFKSDKDKQDSSKKDSNSKTIACPHCNFEQDVSPKIELTFCKNCNKIINVRQLENQQKVGTLNKQPEQKPEKKEPEKPKESIPYQLTKEQEPPKKTIISPAPLDETPLPEPENKGVVCSHCKTEQQVPVIALSSFCKKCGYRINLQDYEIRGKFQGELETRGIIYIAGEADVTAEINVGSGVIEGKVRGNIIAETQVELKSTATVFGTITSPILLVDDGAIFVGKAIIKPKKKP